MRGQMTHPDTDLLAEFRAGLIAGRRGRRIGAHVAGCDRCAALGDRLAGVSALLAGVPPPVMPPSVAHRLDAVLAAEAERKADPERAGGDGLADRAADARPARHRGFRPVQVRLLAPAAAVMLAAAGYGLNQIGRGPNPAPPPGAPRRADEAGALPERGDHGHRLPAGHDPAAAGGRTALGNACAVRTARIPAGQGLRARPDQQNQRDHRDTRREGPLRGPACAGHHRVNRRYPERVGGRSWLLSGQRRRAVLDGAPGTGS